jgi:hypothetical protein
VTDVALFSILVAYSILEAWAIATLMGAGGEGLERSLWGREYAYKLSPLGLSDRVEAPGTERRSRN